MLRWALASSVIASACSAPQYFPDDQTVSDMAALSRAVYHLRNKVRSCHDAQSRNRTLIEAFWDGTGRRGWWGTRGAGAADGPDDLFHFLLPQHECLHYSHDRDLGTQVLIVRSIRGKYVAASYAGTDDWRTLTQDGDILTSDFGPAPDGPHYGDGGVFRAVPAGVRVHRGFNEQVFFDRGRFQAVLGCIASARAGGDCEAAEDEGGGDGSVRRRAGSPSEEASAYRLFTTGHSLGAANSILLGAALHLQYPKEAVRSINFGCPKVGNIEWSYWLDSLQPDRKEKEGEDGSYEVFRFVNKIDLVPRLPLALFSHAGHTLQITYGGDIEAYYDHLGDEDLGYASVPFGWEAASYAFLPGALMSHAVEHYVTNLAAYRSNQTKFERVEDNPAPVPPYTRAEDNNAEVW